MNPYKTKNKPQINADERRFNVLDLRLPVVVRGQKTGTELAKGWGQIVTPLEIETYGSFKTTENTKYTEKYSPSVISVPSVVDYSFFESEKTQER
ncbi:MAG: hypothetical protein Q8M95_12930 [Candidatus Methanoperedens sp.]|nr:hypothetical protein [Candidatus Methanoperedens sp.]